MAASNYKGAIAMLWRNVANSVRDSAEIRIQAERRVGELQRRSRPLVLNEGGRPNTKTPANKERVFKPALEQAGIDYNL